MLRSRSRAFFGCSRSRNFWPAPALRMNTGTVRKKTIFINHNNNWLFQFSSMKWHRNSPNFDFLAPLRLIAIFFLSEGRSRIRVQNYKKPSDGADQNRFGSATLLTVNIYLSQIVSVPKCYSMKCFLLPNLLQSIWMIFWMDSLALLTFSNSSSV